MQQSSAASAAASRAGFSNGWKPFISARFTPDGCKAVQLNGNKVQQSSIAMSTEFLYARKQ
jgi:hypothetical protein